MATCIDLTETKSPNEFKGHTITPTVGSSIMPTLRGTKVTGIQDLYFWEHFGCKAIRKENWKLVKVDNCSEGELYDLSKDRIETNNLAEQNPQKVKEWEQEWEHLAKECHAVPEPK